MQLREKGSTHLIDAGAFLGDGLRSRLVIVGDGVQREALERRVGVAGAAVAFAGPEPQVLA